METLPSNDIMKLCVDCEYIATNGSHSWETYQCMAPENPFRINPVTGDKMYDIKYCTSLRESSTRCSREGVWFKIKLISGFCDSPEKLLGLPPRKSKSAYTISLDDIG